MKQIASLAALILATMTLGVSPVAADPFFFSNGNVNNPNPMATASRPDIPAGAEIESADDFILPSDTLIKSATFTGLLPAGLPASGITDVVVEIYRVFPKDSNTVRIPAVPTRANSPSDVAFDSRDSAANTLSFMTSQLMASFSAANSVLNDIKVAPNPTNPVTGQEVLFTVNFATPFDLPADHYFFVPQVQLTTGNFFWLSSVRPIVAPGTPFAPDLQEWIRNDALDPDWLRVGTDIVGGSPAPTFNAAFTLTGDTVPEPGSLALLASGLVALGLIRRRRNG